MHVLRESVFAGSKHRLVVAFGGKHKFFDGGGCLEGRNRLRSQLAHDVLSQLRIFVIGGIEWVEGGLQYYTFLLEVCVSSRNRLVSYLDGVIVPQLLGFRSRPSVDLPLLEEVKVV